MQQKFLKVMGILLSLVLFAACNQEDRPISALTPEDENAEKIDFAMSVTVEEEIPSNTRSGVGLYAENGKPRINGYQGQTVPVNLLFRTADGSGYGAATKDFTITKIEKVGDKHIISMQIRKGQLTVSGSNPDLLGYEANKTKEWFVSGYIGDNITISNDKKSVQIAPTTTLKVIDTTSPQQKADYMPPSDLHGASSS